MSAVTSARALRAESAARHERQRLARLEWAARVGAGLAVLVLASVAGAALGLARGCIERPARPPAVHRVSGTVAPAAPSRAPVGPTRIGITLRPSPALASAPSAAPSPPPPAAPHTSPGSPP